jgi:outer membrane protein assembly factor BamB
MVTIELGELNQAGFEARAATPAALRRSLLVLIVAASCLLAFGGSARAEAGFGDPLWTAEVSLAGFSLGTGSVYLAETDGRSVFARDLHTGQVRWRLPIADMSLFTIDADGVAAVVTHTPVPGGLYTDATLQLVNEATGSLLVRVPGSMDALTTRGYVLATASRSADCPSEVAGACTDVFALNPTTGAEVWRVSLPPDSYYIPSEAGKRVGSFGEIDQDGRLRIRSTDTGEVTENVLLPFAQRGMQVVLRSDDVIVAVRGDDDVTLTSYHLHPMTRAWSVVVPRQGVVSDYLVWFYLSDCGRVLCVHFDQGGTRMVDPVTGQLGPSIAAEVDGQLGQGVLVGSVGRANGTPGGPVLLDPLDGHLVARLSNDASMVAWPGRGEQALVAVPGTQRTGFVVIDSAGRQRPVGSVPGIGLTCQALADVLVCANAKGELRAWHLPLSPLPLSPRS